MPAAMRMTKKQYNDYLSTLQNKPEDYVPPTLDNVPIKWLDKRSMSKVVDPIAVKKTRRTSEEIKIKRQGWILN